MSTYEFGAPLLTRTSEISDKVGKATVYFPLVVMGKNQRLKLENLKIVSAVSLRSDDFDLSDCRLLLRI